MKMYLFLSCLTLIAIKLSLGTHLVINYIKDNQGFSHHASQSDRELDKPKHPPWSEGINEKSLKAMDFNKFLRQKRQTAVTWDGKQPLDLNLRQSAQQSDTPARRKFKTKKMSELYNRWLSQKEELARKEENLLNNENLMNEENRIKSKDNVMKENVMAKTRFPRTTLLPVSSTVLPYRNRLRHTYYDPSKEKFEENTDTDKKKNDADVKQPTVEDQSYKEIQSEVDAFRSQLLLVANYRPFWQRDIESGGTNRRQDVPRRGRGSFRRRG